MTAQPEITTKIHDASMAILQNTGIKFLHRDALEILKSRGVRLSGETAYFDERQILKWIKPAPARFKLFARNPTFDMELGGDGTEFAAGYGAPFIIDIQGQKRSANYADFQTFLKLIHQSGCFNINGGIPVQPAGAVSETSWPLMLAASIRFSDKCLMGGPSGKDKDQATMDILSLLFGSDDLCKRPRIMKIVNSTSPLVWDRCALESIMSYTHYGQPLVITPGPMAGITSPVTLAGTLAISNAEALAGIALTQMLREGTPVIYGCQATAANMAAGSISIGSPECALCVEYGARLARMYDLPSRGGGANNDAKAVSVQSGYESMMVMLAACMAKMNFIPHSAGVLDSYSAMSFEKFIIDLEIIGRIQRYLKGVRADEDAFALTVIGEAGSGGEYITTDHTLQNFRTEIWSPGIGPGSLTKESSDDNYIATVQHRLRDLLADYCLPDIPAQLMKRINRYLTDEYHIPENVLSRY